MYIQTALVGLPHHPTPTYRLKAGGGQRGVHVFTGHHRSEVVAQNAGLGRLKHHVSDSG
jgi:hypothetical protein